MSSVRARGLDAEGSVLITGRPDPQGRRPVAWVRPDPQRPHGMRCLRGSVAVNADAGFSLGGDPLDYMQMRCQGESLAREAEEDLAADPLSPPPPAAETRARLRENFWRPAPQAERLLLLGRMDEAAEALLGLEGRLQGEDLAEALEKEGWPFSRRMAAAAESMRECPAEQDPAPLLWYGAGGETGRVRRQAAGSMPVLAGIIAASPDLRRAVDGRQSLTDGIRSLYPGMGAGGVKRLGRISGGTADQSALAADPFAAAEGEDAIGVARERHTPLAGAWRTAEAVAWLERAARRTGGVNVVPDSAEEWGSFTTIWSGMIMPLAAQFGAAEDSMCPRPGGSWRKMHESLGRDLECGGQLPDRHQLNIAVVDAAEVAQRLAAEILLPVMIQAAAGRNRRFQAAAWLENPAARLAARETARSMLSPPKAKQPLRQTAQTVRAALTRLTRLDSALEAGQPDDGASRPLVAGWRESWAAPFRDTAVADRSGARVPVSFFRSREEMREESRIMGHCIGQMRGYWSSCWRGTHIAAHIGPPGSADGSASAYFSVDGGGDRLVLREIRGRRNRNPPEECRRAAKALEGGAAAGLETDPLRAEFLRWLATPEAAAAFRRGGAQGEATADPETVWRTGWNRVCGYACENREPLAGLWNVWREILPAAAGVDSPEAWVWRSAAARDALKELDAETHGLLSEAARNRAAAPAAPGR